MSLKEEMILKYTISVKNKMTEYKNYTMLDSGQELYGFNIAMLNEYPREVSQDKNLLIKSIIITDEIELLNEKLLEIYKIHEFVNNTHDTKDDLESLTQSYMLKKYMSLGYELVHGLRCIKDALLDSTQYIEDGTFDRKGKYGHYEESNKEFLDVISTIDNMNKHRLFYNIALNFNPEEPSVFYLVTPKERLPIKEDLKEASIIELVKGFNNLFADYKKTIKLISDKQNG